MENEENKPMPRFDHNSCVAFSFLFFFVFVSVLLCNNTLVYSWLCVLFLKKNGMERIERLTRSDLD